MNSELKRSACTSVPSRLQTVPVKPIVTVPQTVQSRRLGLTRKQYVPCLDGYRGSDRFGRVQARQTKELLDQSCAAHSAISKKSQENFDELSVFRAMDEVDHTALNALHDAQCRLCAECSKSASLIVELHQKYEIENQQFHAYLAQRQANPPKLKPSPGIGSVEGFILILLTLFYAHLCSH